MKTERDWQITEHDWYWQCKQLKLQLAERDRLLRDCIEHMEWSTPQGKSAWEAAKRATDREESAT